METLQTLIILIVAWCIYILPSYIARKRGTEALKGIFIANVLLGWTVIGWFACLVWAYEGRNANTKRDEIRRNKG